MENYPQTLIDFIKTHLSSVKHQYLKRHFEYHHPDEYRDILNKTSFLDNLNKRFIERIYCILNNILTRKKCSQCENYVRFTILEDGYLKFCSPKCAFKDDDIKNKRKKSIILNDSYGEKFKQKHKKTCQERYGYDSVLSCPEIIEKRKQTILQRYGNETWFYTNEFKEKAEKTNILKYGNKHGTFGNKECIEKMKIKRRCTCNKKYNVDYIMQVQEVKDARKRTSLKKYGHEYFSQTLKYKKLFKETMLDRYGVESALQNKTIRKKYIDTMFKKYGVNSPLQNKTIFEKVSKSCFKWKTYILPSKKTVKIQGYEWRFLDEYFKNNNKEDDIIIHGKNIPSIEYLDNDNKSHIYFPDFFIPSTNTIIEVKSIYFLNKDIDTNIKKAKAVIDNGFNFLLKVYDKKIEIIDQSFYQKLKAALGPPDPSAIDVDEML